MRDSSQPPLSRKLMRLSAFQRFHPFSSSLTLPPLLGLSLLSYPTYTKPVYNLQQSLKYPHQYLTRNLDVRF
ncbi:hypothetical protein BV898_15643 [Hypsibius exemplaris]|uniref:Uncharacterized protein n=1 Tax=Hypsibius exemplaris TaxID=2072580 RepID=A0A9X6NDF0_HYPEX|nr:hypothetical protein BV898_15643 [Hypsibius exemplaris]